MNLSPAVWYITPRVLEIVRSYASRVAELEGIAIRTFVALMRVRATCTDRQTLWIVDYVLDASGLARSQELRDRASAIIAAMIAEDERAPLGRGGDA